MAKKELKLHAVVSPTETVVVSAYDENGKADACTLAFYMVSSHIPPCVTIAINVVCICEGNYMETSMNWERNRHVRHIKKRLETVQRKTA